jgi:capsular polysaccharide transport system permease protein
MSKTAIDRTGVRLSAMKLATRKWQLSLQKSSSVLWVRKEVDELEHQPTTGDVAVDTKVGGKTPWRFLSFLVMVAIPFGASLLYFTLVASDQYTAEARFAVRSLAENGPADNADAEILKMGSATQDAYVVTSFIHSTEILRRMGTYLNYKSAYTLADADFLSRFDSEASQEKFLQYWRKMVSAYIDGPSGIVTLQVNSFRPEDSVTLANSILKESEKLINEMSERTRNDILKQGQQEVDRTGRIYLNALAALNRAQRESEFLSPEMQAKEKGQLLTGLLAQKLEIENRLFTMKQSEVVDSPAYRQLEVKRKGIEVQIDKMRDEITGPEHASIVHSLQQFTQLETDRLIAEKLYEAARHNYDAALTESMRKALYLTVFVNPSLPEEALYPRRLMAPALILLGLTILWATLSLAWASVEDHRL